MTTYFGTNNSDVIDGNKLTSDTYWIDAGFGDDIIILAPYQGYISGPGNNSITGVGQYNSYSLWNANQNAYINLQTGIVSNNGFGGVDKIANIDVVQTGNKNSNIVGNNLNNSFCSDKPIVAYGMTFNFNHRINSNKKCKDRSNTI